MVNFAWYVDAGYNTTYDSRTRTTFVLSSTAILSALVRLSEPYVFYTLKEQICCTKVKKRKKYATNTLNSFINSAMNVEFVCLILSGIRSMFEVRKYSLIISDETRVSIKSVVLEDANKWGVDSFEDKTEASTSVVSNNL